MEVEVKELSKKYPNNKKMSLDHVSLSIPRGVFGLIGENGAGKSTLMKTMVTQLQVQSGEIKIYDYHLPKNEKDVRSILGYLPQNFDCFQNLSVFEMLEYIALMKKIMDPVERVKQINNVLDQVNLLEKSNDRVRFLSGGMKQRLGIAQCLLGDPKFIVLDEPTVGLDPGERLRFRNVINDIAKDRVVILSTHIISDISMMCENVAIMKKGRVLYCGTMDKLMETVDNKVYIDVIDSTEVIRKEKYRQIISVSRKKGKLEVRFIDENIEKRKGNEKICMAEPSLEDAYFYVINKDNR